MGYRTAPELVSLRRCPREPEDSQGHSLRACMGTATLCPGWAPGGISWISVILTNVLIDEWCKIKILCIQLDVPSKIDYTERRLQTEKTDA